MYKFYQQEAFFCGANALSLKTDPSWGHIGSTSRVNKHVNIGLQACQAIFIVPKYHNYTNNARSCSPDNIMCKRTQT